MEITKMAWEQAIKPYWLEHGRFDGLLSVGFWKGLLDSPNIELHLLAYIMGSDPNMTVLDSMNCWNSLNATLNDEFYKPITNPSLDVLPRQYRPKRDYETGWLQTVDDA